MGEDDGRLRSLPVIGRREGTAKERPHAEHVEELACNTRALDGDRIAAAGQDVAVPVDGRRQGGEALEARRLRLPLQELRIRELDEARRVAAAGLPAGDEALLLRKRKGLEDDGVQHPERRGARADAQGQRGDGKHRYPRATVVELPSQGVPKVAADVLEPPRAADVAAHFLDLIETAELQSGAPARLPRGHPRPDVVGHLPFDVVAQLGVEVVFDPASAPQAGPPDHREPPPEAC